MAPTVGLIDSGELAAGCRMLNVLHPTGYPLYTLLGRLMSLVPVVAVVNRVAVLSALLGTAGVGLFLWLLRRMGLKTEVAGTTALVLAFSRPVWSVCVDVEVYALTLVLAVVIWLAAESSSQVRSMLVLGYASGLALTNHMSAASVVLGAGIAVLTTDWKHSLKGLPSLIVLLLLGLSPYLFLLLRAKAGPLVAWGNTVNLERFWWHVTGKQYQVWMFTLPFSEVVANVGRGLVLLAAGFAYVLVPAVMYGAYRMFKERRSMALGLAVTAVLSFAYAANYGIPDIEAYYIPCFLALAVFGAVGLDRLARRMGRWHHAVWLPAVMALVLNFSAQSRRADYVAYDQAVNTLASAGANATIFTDWWDVYSPVFYLQHIEGLRPDVCIIDKELMRRSWYFSYLARDYPWLIENSRIELGQYLVYLDQFEHGTLKDAAAIQRNYIQLLESFVFNNPGRPAYTTYTRESGQDARQMFQYTQWIPVGLLFELRGDTLMPEFDYSMLAVRQPPNPDARTQANLDRYGLFARARIQALLARGRDAEAQRVDLWFRSVWTPPRVHGK